MDLLRRALGTRKGYTVVGPISADSEPVPLLPDPPPRARCAKDRRVPRASAGACVLALLSPLFSFVSLLAASFLPFCISASSLFLYSGTAVVLVCRRGRDGPVLAGSAWEEKDGAKPRRRLRWLACTKPQ
jgi:hypothetical protein